MTRRVPTECNCGLMHQHGTNAMYDRHKCGCFACRVHSANRRRRVRGKEPQNEPPRVVSPVGTIRRLQALAVIGVPLPALAERLGTTMQAVDILRSRTADRPVTIATEAKVRALYDELWHAPQHMRRVKTRNCALRRGWAPPLAWDEDTIDDPAAVPWTDDGAPVGVDEIAVDLIAGGHLVVPRNGVTRPELVEAIRQLAARGMSDLQIGNRVGRTYTAVSKIRERNGIPSGVPQPGHLRNKETAA